MTLLMAFDADTLCHADMSAPLMLHAAASFAITLFFLLRATAMPACYCCHYLLRYRYYEITGARHEQCREHTGEMSMNIVDTHIRRQMANAYARRVFTMLLMLFYADIDDALLIIIITSFHHIQKCMATCRLMLLCF